MMNVIYSAASSAGAAGGGRKTPDLEMGIVLLVAGIIFCFLFEILSILSGLKGIKRPKVDFFRILGIIELIGGFYYLASALFNK